MKHFSIILLLLLALMPLAQAQSEQVPATRKEAQEWVKNDLANKKKALGALKKVKDSKSATKAGKELQKIYKKDEGKTTGMGVTGPKKRPTGDAMDAAVEKSEKQMEKLDEAIAAELERIREIDIDSPDFEKGFDAMNGN